MRHHWSRDHTFFRSINNADFAHAQRKMAKMAVSVFLSSKFSTLPRNGDRGIQFVWKLRNCRFGSRAVNMSRSQISIVKLPKFQYFYRKLMSLRMTITTEFGPEVEIIPFLRMQNEKWPKQL